MPNFQKLIDQLQDIVTRYPLELFFYACVISVIPSAISLMTGGSFWCHELNLKIVTFYYGGIPLFMFSSWIAILPIAFWVKYKNAVQRLEQEKLSLQFKEKRAEGFIYEYLAERRKKEREIS